tara:strand:+ start:117 stop:335 length:219 start_codon:yes stop_codon:yes gene_type:complete
MYKIIIIYELSFLFFWNIIYFGTDIKSYADNDLLTLVYIFLATMALGWVLLNTIRIAFGKVPDPRKPSNKKQ